MLIFLQVLVHNTILNNLNIDHCNTCIYISLFLTVSYSKFAFANMRAINKWLSIFNISHNYNCTLSLVYLLYYAFPAFSYPKLAFIILHYLNQFRKRSNKRSLIESVFNVLKKHMHLEHTRHCSPINFFVHIISSLASYSISKLNPYLISSSFSSNPLS
ncbi:transposase domain protein [Orientia tsutsugamushi str. Gilliam]|uniref:Transposase domain protein n=1 Tax=Orientia tsutsugamushi str. Gilliam TaxID=1359184 RepID=A0A0F3M8K4_ORITS|nr:transposase domain protein [Orientia tsutsugamushi str. Gilliam]